LKIKSTSLLIAVALMGAVVMPAQASNDAMMDLLKVLRDRGTITVQDYELLVNAAKADKEVNQAVREEVKASAEKVTTAAASLPKITTKGKIKVESADGNWSFRPIGRIMWDAIDTDEDGSGADNFQGTELRRARLGFQGDIYDWGYKLEVDFDDDDVSIKDAYVKYGTGLAGNKASVKLGQSHIPFGFTTKASSKYMAFIDRPWFADSAVSPARESGVVAALAAPDYSWTLSAGLTNGPISDGETNKNGSTFAVRGSVVPYMQDKNHLVQLGAAYMTVGGGDEFKYSQRLVSHVDDMKWLSTTQADHDGSNAHTFDIFSVYGPAHVLAEYNDFTIESDSDTDITGYAVEFGYFLTGESMVWKKGYTSGITPKSSLGAWQVAARFETLEIDEFNAKDEGDKWTLGINYYPTTNTRLMLDYDKVSDLTVNDIDVDFEPSSLKFRAQVYW
jgi:phosphate-selective porin OprO/OprP